MNRSAVSVGSLTGSLVGALLCSGLAAAAEWTRSAGVAVGALYSSNVCRTPQDEQGEPFATVTPSLDLQADGDRIDFAIRGAIEYNSLGNSNIECPQGGFGNLINRETWVPRGDAYGEVEAVENALFLEADAFATQNPINPFLAGGDNNVNAVGNTNITYRWSTGARLDRQHGDDWSTYLRYNYNEQYNSFNQVLGDTQEDRVELNVGMIPGINRASLRVRGAYSEVTFMETDELSEFENRLARLELRGALELSRRFQLNSSFGEENNNFFSADSEIDGEYWDLGLRYTPNERVTLEAGYGERFFGETPRVSIDYRHKRVNLRADYIRDVQFPRDIRGGGGPFDPTDPLDPGLGLPGEPLPGAGDPTFLGQGPVLNESFVFAYGFTGRRSSLSFRASDSRQVLLINNAEGTFLSATATATRTTGYGLVADVSISYTENEGVLGFGSAVGPEQGLEAWRASLGFRRQLGAGTDLTLRYDYTDQKGAGVFEGGGNSFNSFDEHLVSFTLRFIFGGRDRAGETGEDEQVNSRTNDRQAF
ncbi:MAG: TIGR03016 family PEP-CTERM system-associated outer membrane protein [Pseudomonadota bacterium]